ncbi:MAG: cell division protein FtsA [Patescibacteria group bacterium]|nr:cell division protein FtsA [Patescibacteria group bacterium]
MAREKIFVGIDIGTSKIRTVVASIDASSNDNLNVIGVGVAPSTGIRKGAVVDIEDTIRAITMSVEDAERMAGEPIRDAFIAIGGHHLQTTFSRGVVAVGQTGREISQHDIERVLEAAQSVALPHNQQAIKIVPRSFTIDDQERIKDPTGMTGIRLDVDTLIMSGSTPYIRNIEKCVHESGVGIIDFIPTPLAAAESTLDRRQKELGVCVIDIGAGATSIAIYEEGSLLHAITLGIGSENITNDIAIGLRTSIDTAEKVKIAYGHCLPNEVNKREQIHLGQFSKVDDHQIPRHQLATIIEARMREILTMVKAELRNAGRDGLLPAGAILTGATAKMLGLVELTREVLGLPAQIGQPQNVTGVVEQIKDPSYATVIGSILYGLRHPSHSHSFGNNIKLGGLFSGFSDWVKHLLP